MVSRKNFEWNKNDFCQLFRGTNSATEFVDVWKKSTVFARSCNAPIHDEYPITSSTLILDQLPMTILRWRQLDANVRLILLLLVHLIRRNDQHPIPLTYLLRRKNWYVSLTVCLVVLLHLN